MGMCRQEHLVALERKASLSLLKQGASLDGVAPTIWAYVTPTTFVSK
jgi:hypothetical protein